jgi:hypothetical protein
LKLGKSLNEVDFGKVFELVSVSYQRINLNIDEVDLYSLLKDSPDRIKILENPEVSNNSDTMIEKMVLSGQ